MEKINFCINSNSFAENSNSLDTIYNNIKNLEKVKNNIEEIGDQLFKSENILYEDFYDGKKVYEIIAYNGLIDDNYQKILLSIINRTLDLDDEFITADVRLNDLGNPSLIGTEEDLKKFYYAYIKTIHDEDEFSERINVHFPNLKFHNEISQSIASLKGGLSLFSIQITNSLICLEENLKEFFILSSERIDKALERIESTLGLETTLQGKSKDKLKFIFAKDNGGTKTICCEPHVKLYFSDIEGDTNCYQNRIYFHIGDNEIDNGKVIIGYIGKHIKTSNSKTRD